VWAGAGASASPAQLAPAVTLPSVTLPPVTLPPVTLPPVTVPPLTVPTLPTSAPPASTSPTVTQQTPGGSAPSTLPATTTTTSSTSTTVPHLSVVPVTRPVAAPGLPTGYHLTDLPADTRLAARTAKDLSLPLGLAAAVVVFLLVQGRVERSDPKVADAPVGFDDDTVGFA
jgi:hypothetical protein